MSDKTQAFAKDLQREKWLSLLESGEIKQFRGGLRQARMVLDILPVGLEVAFIESYRVEESFCAIGVYFYKISASDRLSGHLNIYDKIYAETGVPLDILGKIPGMNDLDGLTLPQIAAWIREQMRLMDGTGNA